jgi:hypothetical protein
VNTRRPTGSTPPALAIPLSCPAEGDRESGVRRDPRRQRGGGHNPTGGVAHDQPGRQRVAGQHAGGDQEGRLGSEVVGELDRGQGADGGATHSGAEDADRQTALLRREPESGTCPTHVNEAVKTSGADRKETCCRSICARYGRSGRRLSSDGRSGRSVYPNAVLASSARHDVPSRNAMRGAVRPSPRGGRLKLGRVLFPYGRRPEIHQTILVGGVGAKGRGNPSFGRKNPRER